MRIYILARHYPPEISGGVHRPAHLEKFLVDAGHEVHVFSPQDREQGMYGATHHRIPFGRLRPAPGSGGPIASGKRSLLSRMHGVALSVFRGSAFRVP